MPYSQSEAERMAKAESEQAAEKERRRVYAATLALLTNPEGVEIEIIEHEDPPENRKEAVVRLRQKMQDGAIATFFLTHRGDFEIGGGLKGDVLFDNMRHPVHVAKKDNG